MSNTKNSGVSIAFQALSSNGLKSNENKKLQSEFFIKVANTLEEREAVFKLSYQVYFDKGYIKKQAHERLIRSYDTDEDTVILIVKDQNKQIAGTATLVFDGSMRLPAEKVYGNEINDLKAQGKKSAELCRLVINPNYRNVKDILVLLFNYAAIYIRNIKKYDGLIVEVTPRHKNYYKGLLHFDEIGAEKQCPQVQNTVGVLLYLSAQKYDRELSCAHKFAINKTQERSLYTLFLNPSQEDLAACYLEKQVKPMSIEEKYYFGLSESGISNAVLV